MTLWRTRSLFRTGHTWTSLPMHSPVYTCSIIKFSCHGNEVLLSRIRHALRGEVLLCYMSTPLDSPITLHGSLNFTPLCTEIYIILCGVSHVVLEKLLFTRKQNWIAFLRICKQFCWVLIQKTKIKTAWSQRNLSQVSLCLIELWLTQQTSLHFICVQCSFTAVLKATLLRTEIKVQLC